MEKINIIKKKNLAEYFWISRIIESTENQDQLNSCKVLIENWSNIVKNRIKYYDCPFFKTREIHKTIEAYSRSKKILRTLLAEKSVDIEHKAFKAKLGY
jgi:hypothetical protein